VIYVYANEGGELASIFDPETGEEVGALESTEEVQAACPGDAASPGAKPGHLCVFGSTEINSAPSEFGAGSPAPTTGAIFVFSVGEQGIAKGTWAVNTE
jgi:hypothetical protein